MNKQMIKTNSKYNKMKYFEETEKVPSQIYYHYTTLEALYNIVSTKTFRLTSLKSSNDRKELYYNSEMFLRDLHLVIEEEEHENKRRYFESIVKSIEKNKTDFFKKCKLTSYPYALCLSKKKDNLTHWDRYAANCTGVCIAFNATSLEVLMKRLNIEVFGVGIYDIENVLYDTEKTKETIKEYLTNVIKLLFSHGNLHSDEIVEAVRKNGYLYALGGYLKLAKFAKNESFVDEDEIRLYHDTDSIKETKRLITLMNNDISDMLYSNLQKNFNEFVSTLDIENEQFYISSRGIRGYKNLCLEEVWGNGTIPEIILGPMCTQNKQELIRFLRANGLEGTKVTYSTVPIR